MILCKNNVRGRITMAITKSDFGKTPDGEQVYVYTLDNGTISAEILNYGGIIKNLCVPDRNGNMVDVVLGRDTLEGYLQNDGYLGALIGRYANRIANSRFELNGERYELEMNEGNNCLHGGNIGFDKKVWGVEEKDGEEPSLILTLTSPDGDEGFPGNLDVTVTYTLTKKNALVINYKAVSDKDTVVNLTNHSYFNLAGHDSGPIYDQIINIDAFFYTPNDEDCIPTGEILPIENTPFFLWGFYPIGEKLKMEHEQLKLFGGFDHNFPLRRRSYFYKDTDVEADEKHWNYYPAAFAYCKETGISMTMLTDKPGVQLYTANGLKEGKYKNGAKYGKHHAFCLETQYFPNSMEFAHFPSPVLKAGEEYNFTTEYRFGVK